jgi:hypothetical protein
MKHEWISHEADEPVRQGDLMLARDPKTGRVESLCTVITADCDIAQGKFGRQLAGLRVVSLKDYLRTDWAERKLRSNFDKETERIRDQLNKWNTQRDPGAGPLSSDVVITWVRRREPDEICQDLNIPEPAVAKVRTALARFRSVAQAFDPGESADGLTRLVRLRVAASAKPAGDSRKDILEEAQGSPLPGDVFLLTTLPQLPEVGPAVVLLRELIGIPLGSVCYRSYDAVSKDHFLRIGRLNPVVKYAMSQAFGVLYTRIGLPKAYEDEREAAIELIGSFQWD